jgi:DNA modification methylase/superfamily II DNA or RNA helicase
MIETKKRRSIKIYKDFLKSKLKVFIESGFDIDESELNPLMFPFQKFIVKLALKKGRFAIFADCGLGKTIMQIEWINQVFKFTGKPVIILTPLAVSGQTIKEGLKFGIDIKKLVADALEKTINITNYEQLAKYDVSDVGGVVLDESSILKSYQGQTKQMIIEKFKGIRFKLSCTATPSPNDHLELGNHAEFLEVMRSKEMVSIFFINDAFNKDHTISKWRLKKHATKDFWNWVSTWSIMLSKPSDIGFDDKGYDLPKLTIEELKIDVQKKDNGKLFNDVTVSATDFYKELKASQKERCEAVAEIVNKSKENFIIWVKSNEEEKMICDLIPDAVSVNGSDKPDIKENRLLGFADNEFRVLVTKTKIAQFGLNYQNCHNQIFLSFDFSFEGLYQAIRRSWRFGQLKPVKIILVTVETMGNVLASIKEKQIKFETMQKEMQRAMNEAHNQIAVTDENFRSVEGNNWKLVNGDSTEFIKTIADNSIDFTFFSPPFSDLYMYSNDPRDLSNNKSYEDFFTHFEFMIPELLRITKEGRLLSMHCTQLSTSKGRDGKLEIINFRDDLINAMKKYGWIHHAECVIWKDPKIVAQRTKNMQLLHATTKKDSCVNRMGFPDYLLTFKKEGENIEPVNHERNGIPFDYWCKIAEPVWLEGEIDASDVLSIREAKAEHDEKHMTPTQKEPIKRLYELYSNPGDLIFSPFNGIGTEGYVAIENNRRYIGVELKESYFDLSIKNLTNAELKKKQVSLFDLLEKEAV